MTTTEKEKYRAETHQYKGPVGYVTSTPMPETHAAELCSTMVDPESTRVGYLVQDQRGNRSWHPKASFEENFRKVTNI